MNSLSDLYPKSPSNLPESLMSVKPGHKHHAWLAMLGLLGFIAVYLLLTICFGIICWQGMSEIWNGDIRVMNVFVTCSAFLLLVFMTKSLFAIHKIQLPGGVEVTESDEPELFQFLDTLAKEIGAPKPHRVFITSDVNAAVFYDLSIKNFIFPSKKNLVIGLGLVNVLSLGELKAVLAHEFGHFAQNSMLIGRWVYIAHQIISHMIEKRDWLDQFLRFLSRVDLRIAWVGWIFSTILWSIRSLIDSLFRGVIMAERALSREMEFNADLVAVSVSGSDALIHALHKLQTADEAWQTAVGIAQIEASQGRIIRDLFSAQQYSAQEIRRVMNDPYYGIAPDLPLDESQRPQHRVFREDFARPPQMWATHPANRDREDNAKATYIAVDIDERSAWIVFANDEALREHLSLRLYDQKVLENGVEVEAYDAVTKLFDKVSYSPEYRGTYLNRSIVRRFPSIDELLNSGGIESSAVKSLSTLYPETIVDDLEAVRQLELEKETLKALEHGDLQPSGGVIRHRGSEIKREQIPDAIQLLMEEKSVIDARLSSHDASCRRAHLQAAQSIGFGWPEYLMSLIRALHFIEHLNARVSNEHALLTNTWLVITADNQIGWYERKRILKVSLQVQNEMREISHRLSDFRLNQELLTIIGIEDWEKECPVFDFDDVDKNNWVDWCPLASEVMGAFEQGLGVIQQQLLEALVKAEADVRGHVLEQNLLNQEAPQPIQVPETYAVLLPGDEHVLQRKLDLWNRFQLAHGFFPSVFRFLVSIGIVGGTIYGGFIGL